MLSSPQTLGLIIPHAPSDLADSVLSWDVEVSPGGKKVVLNGTVEEVRSELLKLNPRWDEQYLGEENSTIPLHERSAFEGAHLTCNYPWPPAWLWNIQQGINYLRHMQGHPRLPPGIGKCARVSCDQGSAIWWCNDVSRNTLSPWDRI